MAKDKETPKPTAPSPAEELLTKGTVTLTAKSREDIYAQADAIIQALPTTKRWTRSIVQYHPDTFTFTQTIILKK